MKKIILLSAVLFIVSGLQYCSSPSDGGGTYSHGYFPEVVISGGDDSNHTFTSIKTVRLPNKFLSIEFTYWIIDSLRYGDAINPGFPISFTIYGDSLKIEQEPICGTGITEIYDSKQTLVYILDYAKEASISKIVCYFDLSNPLVVKKIFHNGLW